MPYDALVRDSVLNELHQPFVVDGVEESTDVRIEYPAYLLRCDADRERIQRFMLAASGSESIREAFEVGLVDAVQNLYGGALDYFVFQHGDSDWSLAAVCFGDIGPFDRLRPVRSALQPTGEVQEVCLQVFPVLLPRHFVHPRCGMPLDVEIGFPEEFDVVDMVPERCEPQPLVR